MKLKWQIKILTFLKIGLEEKEYMVKVKYLSLYNIKA